MNSAYGNTPFCKTIETTTSAKIKAPYPTINPLNKTYANPNDIQQRQNNEVDYETKLQLLREQYEIRLKALHEQIAKIYQNISQDEIVNTMKEDATSNEYIGQRVKVNKYL